MLVYCEPRSEWWISSTLLEQAAHFRESRERTFLAEQDRDLDVLPREVVDTADW